MNVKTLCLGALCLQEGTGYDLKQLFEDAFSHFHNASYGSIYPALNKLLDDGLVTVRVEPGERHPDRKLYSITESGRATLIQELISTTPTEKIRSEFMVLMFFSHLLPAERLVALLDEVEERRAVELQYLDSIAEGRASTPGIQFTIDYGRHMNRAAIEFIRSRRVQVTEELRELQDQGGHS